MKKSKTLHVFENGYYLIGNKSVAKCFLFKDEHDCRKFKKGIKKQLENICDILAFGLLHDEFQMVVKLRSRKEIEDQYLQGHKSNIKDVVPETTYIFSQVMANLQSGYVKSFNHRYQRDGGLMKSRYFRHLIETEHELELEIDRVNNLVPKFPRSSIWTFKRKEIFQTEKEKVKWCRSSWRFYNKKYGKIGVEKTEKGQMYSFVKHLKSVYVRGHFDNLPSKSLIPSKMKKFYFNVPFP